MGQGRVRPVFTALLPPGIVVVGRRRHRLRAPSSAAPGGSMAANPEHTAPAPCPPEKGTLPFACSVASALATARGRYHLFPGGGRGVTRLDERPGFGIAFLALAENPAEGGGGVWRPGAARRAAPGLPNKRARPGPLAPGALFQGASRPAAAPPRALGFCTAAPAGKAGREARAFCRPWNGGCRARA